MSLAATLASLGPAQWTARRIAWLGGLFIAAILSTAAYDIVSGHHAAVESTRRELETQGRAIAEQTARSMQAVDIVLRHVAGEYRRGRLARLDRAQLERYLGEVAVGLEQIDGLVLFDARGRTLGSTVPAPESADAARFQAWRDDPTLGFAIFNAARGADGLPVIPVARRLERADAAFAGVVAARARVDYIEQFYRNVQVDPATSINLLRQSGELLVRHPGIESAVGRRFPLSDELLKTNPGVVRQISPVDGVERFIVLKLVPDYPLAVVVTRDAASALAAWRAQAVGTVARTLTLSALAALLLVLLARQLSRLVEARERFALAVAGSEYGIWVYDFVKRRVFASARAREISAMPPGPEIQPMDDWIAAVPIHPEDAPRRMAAMQAHLDGRAASYEGEFRMLLPGGGYRWIRIHGLCVRDALGKPLRMAGSTTDIDVRKRAEEALRLSEEQYRAVFNGTTDALILRDAAGRIVDVNQAWLDMNGFTREEVMTDRSRIFAPPEQHARIREMIARSLAGETRHYELEVERKSGRAHLEIRLLPVLYHGQAHSLSVARDVTAQKRAEEALSASRERFELAVAGSDDGIWDFDFDKRRVFASARARELSGLPPGPEMQSMDEWFAALPLHPEDAPKRLAAMQAHLDGRTPAYDGEFRLLRDGEYRWVRLHGLCLRDASGRPYRMAGSISDVDTRRRAEEGLRASEEQYRAIFNAAADAFVLRDAGGRIVDVNPAFLQISGYSREEVLHGSQWLFAVPEQLATAKQMHRRVIEGESVHFELKARRKDGTPLDVEMRAVPILYRGEPHALGMARDITGQKRAALERAALEGQLLQAKKLEAIGTLAGGIAHDFNNILSAILGYGEMAQKGARAGTALRRHVDAVVSAGMRAKSLVARILAFSRSGIGERAPVNVQSVVAEALDLAAASLPRGMRLERRLESGDAAVMGDPTQIHQVVMNLCANAAQAMKSSGALSVSLDLVEKGDQVLATSALAAGRYVRLSVADTGAGIPANVLERIFDPFFTTKGVGVGTGLGLSLVHGIVTDLGGGIDVHSREGEGSTFTVFLPSDRSVAARQSAEEAAPAGSGETVLLVDDEEALVQLGEEMIAALGYEPVGFTSSAAALAAFRAAPERFSAVLSDETMPDMTGSELAREIRRIRPGIPIVLMTGFVSPALSLRAKELGVVEVLNKPLVSGDIARSLAGALHP